MNRVRIVAIAAVALGAAVIAGTRFQASDDSAQAVAAPAQAMDSAPADLAHALQPAADPAPRVAQQAAPLLRPGAPSLIASALPDAAGEPATGEPAAGQPLSDTGPGLMRASVVPTVDLGGADRAPAQGPAPETLRRLAEVPADVMAAADDGSLPAGTRLEEADPALRAELDACAIWLVVTPAPGAMLDASVYAPCDAGAAVTLTHAGLTFDTRLGGDGQLMVQIPALTEDAGVALGFADGRLQEDRTLVPDLAMLERVVLQWQSPALLLLHAYEFGAGYGDAGHVHAGAPRAAGVADQGFVTVLGDPSVEGAHLAQVYSYPRGENPRDGRVALEIEAPITDASCGRSLTATSIELHGTTSAQVRQIRLDMPECDGNGGFVVLPGVLPELQIALN